jgi:hypothetical protein
VASRWPWRPSLAAAINFSTSAGVRYSRVRISAFGLRVGTFRKMLFGLTTRRFGTTSIFPSIWWRLTDECTFFGKSCGETQGESTCRRL